jgi:hypothetical protein
LVRLARQEECAIVLLDPPGTLATQFLLHLRARRLDGRVIYDRLADTDYVPGYDWLTASDQADPFQRRAENDERIREFAAILLRRRGIHDPAKTPVIEEGLLAALQLYLAQDSPVPLPWLADVFDRRAEAHVYLLEHCTKPALAQKFREYAALSPSVRRAEVAPAERILQAVLHSPAFQVRSGGATFALEQFLNERGVLILDGSSHGNLSRDAVSVMMGAIILRIIRHCRTGSKCRVVLVLDEAVNADLIGLQESRALAEAGKWNLEFHILVQSPFSFPSEDIRQNVLQNCWRHEWFRQGSPAAARLAAEDVAIPLLNPLQVHHTEQSVRTAIAGFHRLRLASGNEWTDASGKKRRLTSWHTILWPHSRVIREEQDRYTTLADQILLMQKELMQLRPGWRFVRSDTVTPAPEYVKLLRHKWSLLGSWSDRDGFLGIGADEAKVSDILAMLKQHPTFRPPALVLPASGVSARSAARRLETRETAL